MARRRDRRIHSSPGSMKLALWVLGLAFAIECHAQSTVPRAIQAAYPEIGFGSVARSPLSEKEARQLRVADVRQILDLANKRADIRKPISAIYFTNSHHAEVTGGLARKSGDQQTEFEVQKKNGTWRIIRGSVYHPKMIITD